jgi:hypothetical protein
MESREDAFRVVERRAGGVAYPRPRPRAHALLRRLSRHGRGPLIQRLLRHVAPTSASTERARESEVCSGTQLSGTFDHVFASWAQLSRVSARSTEGRGRRTGRIAHPRESSEAAEALDAVGTRSRASAWRAQGAPLAPALRLLAGRRSRCHHPPLTLHHLSPCRPHCTFFALLFSHPRRPIRPPLSSVRSSTRRQDRHPAGHDFRPPPPPCVRRADGHSVHSLIA